MTNTTHLPNAPLVFVLAVIRISQYPNFDQKFENAHEALLNLFPERENVGINVLTSDRSGQPRFEQKPLWRIYNRVSNTSLLMGNDQFVFEWTHYLSFEEAVDHTLCALHALFEQLPNLTPTLVGLRYINALMDKDPLTLECAIKPELRGFRLEGKELLYSESNTTLRFESGSTLATRFQLGHTKKDFTPMPSGIAVPNVLAPNDKLIQFTNFEGRYGLLDLDSSVEPDVNKLSADEILELFRTLRGEMRPVLSRLVDPQTVKSWS